MNLKFLDYQATAKIRSKINTLGRTEDIKFSSDESIMAIVEYRKNRVILFEISIDGDNLSQVIKISNYTIIKSNDFHDPHGITFLGPKHFVVANRSGEVNLFKCPEESSNLSEVELMPLAIFKGQGYYGRISAPGSVESYKISNNKYRVLVCNNYICTVVSFVVDLADKVSVKNKGLTVKRGLIIPDGVNVSPNRKWVAVSSHKTNEVLIYRLTPVLNWMLTPFSSILNRLTKPVGRLKGLSYPHGLQFSKDGCKIFVADAGEPYINIYQSSDGNWDNHFVPVKKVKVLDDITFGKESNNPQEGGIKGLDFANNNQLLATTTEHQTLAFHAVSDY